MSSYMNITPALKRLLNGGRITSLQTEREIRRETEEKQKRRDNSSVLNEVFRVLK